MFISFPAFEVFVFSVATILGTKTSSFQERFGSMSGTTIISFSSTPPIRIFLLRFQVKRGIGSPALPINQHLRLCQITVREEPQQILDYPPLTTFRPSLSRSFIVPVIITMQMYTAEEHHQLWNVCRARIGLRHVHSPTNYKQEPVQ